MIVELSDAIQSDRARVIETDIRVAASIHEAGHAFTTWLLLGEAPELLMPRVLQRDGIFFCDGHAETRVNLARLSIDERELIILSGYCNELLFQDETAIRAGHHCYAHADKALNDFLSYAHLHKRNDLIAMLRTKEAADMAVKIIVNSAFDKNYIKIRPFRNNLIELANTIYNHWQNQQFESTCFRPQIS